MSKDYYIIVDFVPVFGCDFDIEDNVFLGVHYFAWSFVLEWADLCGLIGYEKIDISSIEDLELFEKYLAWIGGCFLEGLIGLSIDLW